MVILVSMAFAGSLDDTRATAQRFPQDYSAQVALAQTATDPQEVLRAWQAAAALVPGGNLETDVGLVSAELAVGDVAAARRAAAAAVARDPASAVVWRLDTWARVTPTSLEAPEWAELSSEPSLAHARRLDPDSPYTWCARGYSRLRLGDDATARQDFAKAGTCAGTVPPSKAGAVGLFGAVDLFAGGDVAVDTTAWAGGHVADRVYGELFVRDVETLPATGAPAGTTLEALGRAGYDTGEVGADLDGGVLVSLSPTTGVVPVVGGRVRLTHGVGLGGSGVVTLYDDLTAWQGEAHVDVPLVRALHLTLGGQLDQAGPLGFAALSLRTHPVDVTLGGRFGTEERPVDLDTFTVWDVPRTFGPGASLDTRIHLARHVDLHVGYALHLLPPTATDAAGALHQLSLGIVYGGSP